MKAITPSRFAVVTGASAAMLGLAVLIAPEFGSADASLWRILTGSAGADERMIVLSLRLPRALLAAMAGGTLAACGASMQAMLGNPLACPYTLGIAGGASLAAVLAMRLGLYASALPVAAFAGALVATAAVWGLARLGRRGHMTREGLLLAGVTLAFISSAGVLMVQYMAEPLEVARIVRWMMGGLEVVGMSKFAGAMPVLLPGLAIVFAQAGRLNQIALGEDLAASRGVDVGRVRLFVLIGTALATGAAVAVAGPIAFVGLIVPHVIRRMIGADLRLLMPCAFLVGGAFLVLCDTAARTVIAPSQIPVGVITALLGGPFFLALLARGKA